MFNPVSPKLSVTEMEEKVLAFWKERDIFHQTMESRKDGKPFVFFEGPPTANGRPGVHHLLARVFKDMFPRYQTMRGRYVLRRGGWDTHGLPVEIEVEKKLGFTNKSQIEDYGIARFNELCRESAFTYIQDWVRLSDRLGFWVDFDTAYITYKNEYIESVWWILRQLWAKELIYRGYKVVPFCPRCGTPLSDHEVALGYRDAVDPSVFVRLPLVDEPGTSLLIWTTTPWTLPANVAVAAHPEVTYAKVLHRKPDGGEERLILAESLLPSVFPGEDVQVLERCSGKELNGRQYEPLFRFLTPDKPCWRVVNAEYVTVEDGTGLVHIAPAFGAEDMALVQPENLPVLMTIGPDGRFLPEISPWQGIFVKDADPAITENLRERGLLLRAGTVTHTYPFCWRCTTPLLYFARPTWYIRTSQYRDQLVSLNNTINWYPGHIRNGRFGNWLENNVDWALGRERYWGTPLPVWICQDCGHEHLVGSVAELSQMAGKDLDTLDLHRPHVDGVELRCPKCTGTMRRIPELIDVWFDSGSMPVAQWHYPFENQEDFAQQFPADYICEAVDQTRGWFYSLHAISTMLFDTPSFKNVICLGLILDNEGLKMSKSRGNVVDPWDVLNRHGADAARWYLYTATPPGQERRFSTDLVGEVVSKFTLTLWNTYSFLVTYANLDGWTPASSTNPEYSTLDRWLQSALHALVRDVTEAFENYDVLGATRPTETFIDQLSNWYLRRSRRRFWKSEADGDKQAAYATLYQALVTVAKLLAPTMPFIAEEIYRNLVCGFDAQAVESVHLADWPGYDPALIDDGLNREMTLVMRLASLGHAARNKAGRKVRQPLAEVAFAVGNAEEQAIPLRYAELLEDELNVKQVRTLGQAGEAVSYSLNPLPRQLGQKYGARFPALRTAILGLDAAEAAKVLLAGQPLPLELDGEMYAILPEEVEVRIQARSGFAVASEGAYLAALVTDLTPELVQEGLAREFVRRVQEARKEQGLEISDRIRLNFQASAELEKAIANFRDYVMNETLALELVPSLAGEEPLVSDQFDGETIQFALKKVG